VALDRTADTWDDQGYLLVLLLLPLVLPLFRRGWILCLLPIVLFTAPESARAQGWDSLWFTPDQQGQRALQQGDNKAATELFENPEWAGTAAYQGEEFETAAKYFSEGNSGADWYNRGNALAKDGQIDEAIEAYKESLSLHPGQLDAEENLALLEQLKQQQEQQEQQDNEDQQQSDEQKDSDNQDSSAQSGEQQDGEQNPPDQDQGEESPPGEDEPEDPTENEDSGQEEEEEPGDSSEQEDEQQESSEQEEDVTPAQAEEASPEDQEEEQAMEQWLRRIPDDPSGLLREKFKYESQQRQARGDGRKNESYW
jgi:Ca-activated chloride channel family protein